METILPFVYLTLLVILQLDLLALAALLLVKLKVWARFKYYGRIIR